MKMFTALTTLVLAISIISAANVELPNVKIVDCEEIGLSGFDTCLTIKFSYLEENAGLNNLGSKYVLVGKLYSLDGTENKDSRVSASFESETDFFVAIHDPSDEELYKLKVDLETGDSQMWLLSKDVELDNALRPPGERLLRPTVPKERQVAMPSSGFRMTVQPMVDQSFRNEHGNKVNDRVNAIIAHARTFFKHASLGTKYELDVKALHNYPNTLRATGAALESLNSYVVGAGSGLPLVNTYSLLSMRDSGGAAGIAWKGTVCESRQWRTNINEYYGDLDTAQILVHEIGHNLNMDHDFIGSNPDSPRYSSTGQPCTDIDSYMDYYNDPNKWSPCSVEDITEYYNQVGPARYGTSCMTLLDETDDGTTPETPTTDSPTDDPATDSPTDSPTTFNPTVDPGTCGIPSWVSDGYCDDETNTVECNWDGGDCCNNNSDYWDISCFDCECLDPNAGPGSGPSCEDIWDEWKCEWKSLLDKCHKNKVKANCQKTCGLC